MNIPFRTDKYSLNLWAEQNGKEQQVSGTDNFSEISAQIFQNEENDVLKIKCKLSCKSDFFADRLFLRLGIDTYMKTFPEWNDKFFPTLIRCEKQGVWGCLMSPVGKMLALASPDKFISWKNEYEHKFDVGHRIFTVSLDILNKFKQPAGHPEPCNKLARGEHEYTVYLKILNKEAELDEFVKDYSDIEICRFEKYTLEEWEAPAPLFNEKYELVNKNGRCDVKFDKENTARTRLYIRKPWSYYLECAAKHVQNCQQKSGSHTESWYGYFTLAVYGEYIKDERYTKELTKQFDEFYRFNTSRITGKLKAGAKPKRLQNTSCMISLLTAFYNLTKDIKYLNSAEILSHQLMDLQKEDGAYYSGKTHYTCVIYPAKSMLELALAEKEAGLSERFNIHYASAERAIKNLAELLDNIETEGDMTFEDGMISCEALQLAYLALNTDDKKLKKELTEIAEYILKKHRCLEQIFAPDARIKGCTLRFWEARYDVNFNSNMMNSPHGWTSWKTYATYYLYLLTGKQCYLRDTMDTMGACVQCIGDDEKLNWAYIPDPCIRGKKMVPSNNRRGFDFENVVIGEEYLPTVSDWYKTNPRKFVFQYILNFRLLPNKFSRDYGGSCDNDVNEHFKCLGETVLGKAFVHIENGKELLYGCKRGDNGYVSAGDTPKTLVVFSDFDDSVIFNNKKYALSHGVNVISL